MHRRIGSYLRVLLAAIFCVTWAVSGVPASAAGDPRTAEQWGLSVIRAPEAWGAGIGAGITIAVVDTGVDFGHQDLNVGAKLLPGRNILNPDSSAQDDNGHGTHVAGIAAAATGNGIGVAGTAPGASILPVKVLGEDGSGSAKDVATGIRWAAGDGAGAPRAQVINLSLGSDLPPLAALFGSGLEEAVEYAWSRGVVVVLAAGNNFVFASSSGETPAIVVTATNRQDGRPSYASAVGSARWGMAAPGGSVSDNSGGIMSTYRPNSYRYLAGTSMSAPHVAGAAAVLRAQGLSPRQTIDRLLATAKDIGEPGRDSIFGNGRLDLGCAAGNCATPATTTTGATTATTRPPEGGSGTTEPGGTSGSGSSDSGGSGSAPAPTAGSGGSAGSSGSSGSSASGAGGTGAAAGPSRARSKNAAGRPGGPASPSESPPSADPAHSGPGGAVPSAQVGVDRPSDGRLAEEKPARPLEAIKLARPAAVEERADPALATAAAGLLLLMSFSALGLRRRLRLRQLE